jgi:transcriptional regulator with XRE-family HTH domain
MIAGDQTCPMRASSWRQPSDPDQVGRLVVGSAVLQYRRRKGWSQRQLSWLVGVHQTTISRLEKGTISGMRYSTLVRILGELSVPREALLLEEGPPPPTRRLPRLEEDSYSAETHR